MSGILIVDDEESVLSVLHRIFELLMPGCTISTAKNGPAAWQELQQHSFDLLITDHNMPGMTGLELAQQAQSQTPNLRIVLMSGSSDSEIEAKARKMGLTAFLSKPFSIHQLRDLLETILVPA